MHLTQGANSSSHKSNNFLQSLKLKYTATKNVKPHGDHQTFLNAYASLRPQNDHSTDRYQKGDRSPLNNQNQYQTNKESNVNKRKSIVDITYYQPGRVNALKQRNKNFSIQRKTSFTTMKNMAGERSLPRFQESIKIERSKCSIRKENTTVYDQKPRKQAEREQKEAFKQCDSPIKLIYDSNQNEQQLGSLPLKVQPKAKTNQIEHYYKLQRQKTTKTISNIQNILASIRNTLNK